MDQEAKKRGIRTGAQTLVGLIVGLIVVVWNVEGVPQAVFDYTTSQAALFFGTSSGVAGLLAYFMNRKPR